MIRASDHLDYETVEDRFFNRVADTARNKVFTVMRDRKFPLDISLEWAECYNEPSWDATRARLYVIASRWATIDVRTALFFENEIDKIDRALHHAKPATMKRP